MQKMGLLKRYVEYVKTAPERSHAIKMKYQHENWFVCPDCGDMMKPIIVGLGAAVRESRVKCAGCGFVMNVADAKRQLKRPEY